MNRPKQRFGNFVLDIESGQLFRDGRPVKIQPQPLRVLATLAERAGELVSRDELRTRIWDKATFVEFDQGLNYAIRQIRIALGDNATSPRFIETVKGLGYRFVASVTTDAGTARAADRFPNLHYRRHRRFTSSSFRSFSALLWPSPRSPACGSFIVSSTPRPSRRAQRTTFGK